MGNPLGEALPFQGISYREGRDLATHPASRPALRCSGRPGTGMRRERLYPIGVSATPYCARVPRGGNQIAGKGGAHAEGNDQAQNGFHLLISAVVMARLISRQ